MCNIVRTNRNFNSLLIYLSTSAVDSIENIHVCTYVYIAIRGKITEPHRFRFALLIHTCQQISAVRFGRLDVLQLEFYFIFVDLCDFSC